MLKVFGWWALRQQIQPNRARVVERRTRTVGAPRDAKGGPRDRALRSEIFTREELRNHALFLAEGHQVFSSRSGERLMFNRFDENFLLIERAYFAFSEAAKNQEQLSPGAEWLLDNFHIVQDQVRDIRRHLPRGFYRRLPKLRGGDFAGFPRVFHLALELVSHTDAVVTRDQISAFIEAYQSKSVLSTGELWAVPIMLRLALIENLRRLATATLIAREDRVAADELLEAIFANTERSKTDTLLYFAERMRARPGMLAPAAAAHLIRRLRGRGAQLGLTLNWFEEKLKERGFDSEELIRTEQQSQAVDQISIGNTITSLRTLDSLDWHDWVESVSWVDAVLRRDPVNYYVRCDFETRDLYRHEIEKLARRRRADEVKVAEEAIACAHDEKDRLEELGEVAAGSDEFNRVCHVGYYLVGEGRRQLRKRLKLRPTLRRLFNSWKRHVAFPLYVTAIFALALTLMAYLGVLTLASGEGLLLLLVALLLGAFPISDLSHNLVQWLITLGGSPQRLCKLDFSKGISSEFRTVVAVHTIFSGRAGVERAVDGLEVRFLGNSDTKLHFALLADLFDCSTEHDPQDEGLISHAEELIAELNERHFPGAEGRFLLLFRGRRWNESEKRFMGWERKRGKVEEFNRLLTGETDTSFKFHVGNPEQLRGVRFVITLDVDSQLPRGVASRLVGALAHPLNRPRIDPNSRKVVEGYGVIQPRVGVALTSAHASRFARVFSGHSGLDPYTQAVSDVYQDLFQEGTYIGKAIYDVAAFEEALRDRVPENTLLSHDLFEGLFARTALATDIELFDDFPSKYNAYAKRQHRWVRGDWQLLPWVALTTPKRGGSTEPNAISMLGLWKILDNFRRSLMAPSCFALLVLAWTLSSTAAIIWTGFVLVVLSFPIFTNLASTLIMPPLGLSLSNYFKGVSRDLGRHAQQTIFGISFLPYQAFLMGHAIAVTLYRVLVSKRNLLEWETAYHSQERLGNDLLSYLVQMSPGLLLSVLGAVILWAGGSENLWLAAPFFALWFVSPWIAFEVSRPLHRKRYQLDTSEREQLHDIAWVTWRYFDELLVEEHNFLIPDNIQLQPDIRIANRTSPTNISLSIMSLVGAYELGFVTLTECLARLEEVYDSLTRLERYNGHFFNWYDTTSLEPLSPRYISYVDSGNLAGHLVAVRVAFEDFLNAPLVHRSAWGLIERRLTALVGLQRGLGRELRERLPGVTAQITTVLGEDLASLRRGAGALEQLTALLKQELEADRVVNPELRVELKRLQKLALSIIEASHHVDWSESWRELEVELEQCLTAGEPKSDELKQWLANGREIVQEFSRTRLTPAYLVRLFGGFNELTSGLEDLLESSDLSEESQDKLKVRISAFRESWYRSAEVNEKVIAVLGDLVSQSNVFINEMDFGFLYNPKSGLFSIGYNADNARLDDSHYDLLASEARLGSLIAIAKGDVPQKHWFRMGRGLADSPGGKVLLSWSATMFEYLMPLLVMKDYPGTLLSESYRAVVVAQRAYAAQRGVPWGISESGYSGVDYERTYQYRAFGVPGLGLKRGLTDDLVVSPYSTFLALLVAPKESLRNIGRLESEGLRGPYGFYEAIDYTPERLSIDEKAHIVRSFLAHHQGMTLLAICNVLTGNIFQNRFHRDPIVKASELLLHERFPDRVPTSVPHQAELSLLEHEAARSPITQGWKYLTPHTRYPRTGLLSNGRYSLVVDNAGSGFAVFDRELLLSRWREDGVCNDYGQYLFVRDLDNGKVWSTSYQPTRVEPERYEAIFGPDKIEFKRRDGSIGLHTEITVSPEDNVEVRRVHITNFSGSKRNIELTSFFEIALASRAADAAHPAFSKMFIESEFRSEFDALVFSRRKRAPEEQPVYLFHMLSLPVCWARTQYESARASFIGRGRTALNPIALEGGYTLPGNVGAVLDPVASLRARVEVEPGATVEVVFTTGFASEAEEVDALVRRYKELPSIARAFEVAWSQSNVELRQEQFSVAETQVFQKLANALLVNIEKLRGEPDTIAQNTLTQPALWRFGISGDESIVLLRINEPGQIALVRELLLAHEYLRARGIVFDLVIVNEYPGGYFQNFHEELEALVRSSFSGSLIDQRGGVFIRTGIQLSEEDLILLQSVARVVLWGLKGSLGSQLDLRGRISSPRFSGDRRGVLGFVRPSMMPAYEPPKFDYEFGNGLGGFIDGGHSYHMALQAETLPPQPWCNVIANPDFGFLVSEAGGGYTWSQNSRENRLTPWYNDPVSDRSGEAIYIRDAASGAFWSPTPLPAGGANWYSVKHSLGFSEFQTQSQGIHSRLSLSGSLVEPVKWWSIELSNGDAVPREVEVFLYIEWVLGVARWDSYRHLVTGYDATGGFLWARNNYNNEFAGRIALVGANRGFSAYTTNREEFVGRNGDLSRPAALSAAMSSSLASLVANQKKSVRLSGRVGAGFDSCAVCSVMVRLEPGERREVLLYLSEAADYEDARAKARIYRSPDNCMAERMQVHDFWRDRTSQSVIRTPDRSFDIIMNSWLLYQTISCRLFARSAYFQSGGAIGFRDQLQDVLALLDAWPDKAREQILLHSSRQFLEGDVQHWWHPPTGRGVRTRISDDYLWLPYVVSEYVANTGDRSILAEEVAFIEGDRLEEGQMESYIVPRVSEHRATIHEHCVIALDRALDFGPHGLPRIGGGDWNDGMNLVGREGKGESVWLGWFIAHLLARYEPILRERRDDYRADLYVEKREALRKALEEHGWDGEWYRRAYFDDGTPLGSISAAECRIDSLSQSWAVITGLGDSERVKTAMRSVDQQLVREDDGLICLLTPPFNSSEPSPGYIQGYLPGIRENGGQYTHAAAWVIWAQALLGRGERANELFRMINPISHTSDEHRVRVYQTEPYVFCGDVYAVDPYRGRGGWSWYTGSAGWLYRVGLQGICGLQRKGTQLSINPCISRRWEWMEVDWRWEGVLFRIIISNPDQVESGVRAVRVNGQLLEGSTVNLGDYRNQSEVEVKVELGVI